MASFYRLSAEYVMMGRADEWERYCGACHQNKCWIVHQGIYDAVCRGLRSVCGCNCHVSLHDRERHGADVAGVSKVVTTKESATQTTHLWSFDAIDETPSANEITLAALLADRASSTINRPGWCLWSPPWWITLGTFDEIVADSHSDSSSRPTE